MYKKYFLNVVCCTGKARNFSFCGKVFGFFHHDLKCRFALVGLTRRARPTGSTWKQFVVDNIAYDNYKAVLRVPSVLEMTRFTSHKPRAQIFHINFRSLISIKCSHFAVYRRYYFFDKNMWRKLDRTSLTSTKAC